MAKGLVTLSNRRIQTFRRIFGDESPKCLHMRLRCWRLFGDISPTKSDSGAWSLVKISSTSSVPLPGVRALLPPWTIIWQQFWFIIWLRKLRSVPL